MPDTFNTLKINNFTKTQISLRYLKCKILLSTKETLYHIDQELIFLHSHKQRQLEMYSNEQTPCYLSAKLWVHEIKFYGKIINKIGSQFIHFMTNASTDASRKSNLVAGDRMARGHLSLTQPRARDAASQQNFNFQVNYELRKESYRKSNDKDGEDERKIK